MQVKELFTELTSEYLEDSIDSFYYHRIFDVMIDNDFLCPAETGELQIINEQAYEEFMRTCQILAEQQHAEIVYGALTKTFLGVASAINKITGQANYIGKFTQAVEITEQIKEQMKLAKAERAISEDISLSAMAFMQKNAQYCLKFDNTLRPHHIREPLSKYQKDVFLGMGKNLVDMYKYLFLDMTAMAIRDKLLLADPSRDKWMITRVLHKMGNFVRVQIQAEEKVKKLDNFISREHPMSAVESRLRELSFDTSMTDTEKGIQAALALKNLESVRAGNSTFITAWGKRTGLFKKTDRMCRMTKEVRTAMLAALVLGLKAEEPKNYEGVTFEIPEVCEVKDLIRNTQENSPNKDIETILEQMVQKVHADRKAEVNIHREMVGLPPLMTRADYAECRQKGDTSMDVNIMTIKRQEFNAPEIMDKLDKGYFVRIDMNDGFFAVLKKEQSKNCSKSFSKQLVKFNCAFEDGYNKYSAERLESAKTIPPEMTFFKDISFTQNDLDSCIDKLDSIRFAYDLGSISRDKGKILTAVQNCGDELHILHGSIYINGHDYTELFQSNDSINILRQVAIKESICRSHNLIYLPAVLESTSKAIAETPMRKIQDIKNITPGFDQQSFYQTIAKSIEKIDADLEPLHEVLSNAKPQDITEKIKSYQVDCCLISSRTLLEK